MTIMPRRYVADTPRDLAAMAALLQEAWNPAPRPYTNLHIGDLYWRLRDKLYEQTLWLWEDEHGDLAGFAESLLDGGEATLEMQIHPRWAGGDLSERILSWAEGQAVPTHKLTAYAAERDDGFRAILDARGYQRTGDYLNFHARRLDDGPLELPPLPDGYTVRHLAGPGEVEKRVKGHGDGWQSTKMTVEKYQRLMRMPGYHRELDIVVVAPNSSFVATCNCWLDEKNGVGLFEPVSTSAQHRRQGLGRALITMGLEQLQGLGARWAWVISKSDNLASTGLYEKCGLMVVERYFTYKQP